MAGIIETLAKAKELGALIKKKKNDLCWMTANNEVHKKILQAKIKLHAALSIEIPQLTETIRQRDLHLTKLSEFLDKHDGSMENIEEVERVAAKLAKLVKEVSVLQARLESQTNGTLGTTPA